MRPQARRSAGDDYGDTISLRLLGRVDGWRRRPDCCFPTEGRKTEKASASSEGASASLGLTNQIGLDQASSRFDAALTCGRIDGHTVGIAYRVLRLVRLALARRSGPAR